MKIFGLLSKLAIFTLVFATLVGCTTDKTKESEGPYIPSPTSKFYGPVPGGGDTFVMKQGQFVVIYGQRSSCMRSEVPYFSLDAVSIHPKHGKLSDGGSGWRESRSCGVELPYGCSSTHPTPALSGRITWSSFPRMLFS